MDAIPSSLQYTGIVLPQNVQLFRVPALMRGELAVHQVQEHREAVGVRRVH